MSVLVAVMNDQVEEQMVEISLDTVTWLSQCCAEPTNYHMVHNTYIIKKLHNWLHSGRTAVLYSVDQNLPSPCRSRLARETMCAYSWNRKANVILWYDHDPQLKVPTDCIHQRGLTLTQSNIQFILFLSVMQVMSSSISTHLPSCGSYPSSDIVLDKCMTLWGKLERVHMQNMK